MPDRVTRQFGRVQRLSGMCIMHDTCVFSACLRSYKKIYDDHDTTWDQLSTHSFRPEEFGMLVIDTREPTTDHYMHWYESHNHVRVSNPAREGAPPDVPAVAPPVTSYSRDAWYIYITNVPIYNKFRYYNKYNYNL
ncbi:hypothetical protein LIER_12233 [Lithospermum erythrorhizon]|uniref:Uncharacterized protein n=1 Tax=Lithospermum erythrorhizon TaxID=34254 RepID=A0AAV3PVA6_LITER